MSEDAPKHAAPIIIKKVISGHGGHHGGAWKVAYADLVTALMALFIVLWILSQSDQVVRSVAGYFRDPIGFVEGGSSSVTETGTNTGEITVLTGSQPASQTTPLVVDEPDPRWRERARRIRGALKASSELERYQEQVEIAMTPAGLTITLLETSDKPLFRPGDEVYGDVGSPDGAFAEYLSAPQDLVESKPTNVSFEQAAAIPLAANTALTGLRDAARLQAGQHILINGSSGGVGTFAVQIVFKDTAAFVAPSGEEAIQKRLFPDRARFLKEEQRRFEILDAHWDVPLNELDLK